MNLSCQVKSYTPHLKNKCMLRRNQILTSRSCSLWSCPWRTIRQANEEIRRRSSGPTSHWTQWATTPVSISKSSKDCCYHQLHRRGWCFESFNKPIAEVLDLTFNSIRNQQTCKNGSWVQVNQFLAFLSLRRTQEGISSKIVNSVSLSCIWEKEKTVWFWNKSWYPIARTTLSRLMKKRSIRNLKR